MKQFCWMRFKLNPTLAVRIERAGTEEQVVGFLKCVGLEHPDLCTVCWMEETRMCRRPGPSFSLGFSRTQAVYFSHILNLAKAKRHSLQHSPGTQGM